MHARHNRHLFIYFHSIRFQTENIVGIYPLLCLDYDFSSKQNPVLYTGNIFVSIEIFSLGCRYLFYLFCNQTIAEHKQSVYKEKTRI